MQRSILITGCSSGIGYTCAIGMKQRGWHVIATARKPEDLKMLEAQGLATIELDYTDPSSIAACAEKTLELTNGKLDALFNNGAYGQPGLVEDLSVAALRAQFEANFFGWHDLTTRLLPAMHTQGRGRIIQCSSVLGFFATPYRGAYNASKFALEGLTDTMRRELHDTGIKVSTIQPGPIRSRFTQRALAELKKNIDYAKGRNSKLYEQRIAELEKIAGSTPAPLETPAESRDKTGYGWKPKYRLGPDAVLAALIHATESANPKTHYRVTYSTQMAAFARRFLPVKLQDRMSRNS